jgi:hypothetical protein
MGLNSSDWAHHRRVRGKLVNNEMKTVPSGFEAVSRNLQGLRTNTEDLNEDIQSLDRNLNPPESMGPSGTFDPVSTKRELTK